MPLIVYSQEMRGEAGAAIFLHILQGKIDQVLDIETNTFTRFVSGSQIWKPELYMAHMAQPLSFRIYALHCIGVESFSSQKYW